MTLTETRPEAAGAEPAAVAARPGPDLWPASADHKRIGLVYIGLSLVLLVVGLVLGDLLRVRLSSDSSNLLGTSTLRVFSMHATVLFLLVLGPLWLGIETYVVPLQIGSSRLALPRLHAFAMWLYVVGSGLVIAGYISGRPTGLGFSVSAPPAAPAGGANTATILVIGGLFLVALGTLLASIDLAVTILAFRTEGLTFARLPMFTTATFATSVVAVLSTPVFLAGLVLFYYDQRTGGHFFAATNRGGQAVWEHTLWLFGRPEAYLLVLPGLGAACDIVSTHARKPLLSRPGARALMMVFAALTFTAWAAGVQAGTAVVVPTYTIGTALIAAPVALLALMWLGTVALGSPRFHASLLFVLGFLGVALFAAANTIVVAFKHLTPADGEWTMTHAYLVAFAAPLLLALAALCHWGPKMLGRRLSTGVGALAFLLTFGGLVIEGLGGYLLGYNHAPAHVTRYTDSGLLNDARIAAVGGALVIVGVLLLIVDLFRAAAGGGTAAPGDPYEGSTLEWATSSPPPPANFDSVPEVRSATPLADLRPAATEGAAR